jgi:hypothetical protein
MIHLHHLQVFWQRPLPGVPHLEVNLPDLQEALPSKPAIQEGFVRQRRKEVAVEVVL